MVKVAIYGAGGFGREVAPLARAFADDIVFVSDDPSQVGGMLNGIRIIDFDTLRREPDRLISITVADGPARRAIAERCRAEGLRFSTIKAQTYIGYDEVDIGEGALFCDFTMCTSNVRIGRFFHANIYSYIAHDSVIGDYVTLAPRVCINGNIVIEDDVYVGTGAAFKQGKPGKPLIIGRGAVVGMGAVVTKDVEPGTVVVGNPARPLEKQPNA
jgi:sugar O-acyltransferase (sialic acid O-acetyltransferase NeuD family)